MEGTLCLYENKITSHSTRYSFKQNAVCARACFVALNTGQNLYKKIPAS